MKKDEETLKSFHDLVTEVQDRGICGKCGGCVSFCSAGELNALSIGRDGAPYFVDEDKCLKCGICYLICPHIGVLNPELKSRFGWRPPVGPFRSVSSARTTDERVKKVCTDGGVVTSLLIYALKRNVIQGALVSKRIGLFEREPVLVTEPEEVLGAAGSHFEESRHIEEVGMEYTTYSSKMIEIKNMGRRRIENIALVGTPCQVYTVRKMQLLNIIPADLISLTIGLFCMENFAFGETAKRKLERRMKVKLDDIVKLNVKDDIIVTLKGNKIVHIPFEIVDEVANPGCFACPDFANDYADIAVGGLGSPDGYTTTLVRTTLGERLYNGAKQNKFIEEMCFKSKEDEILHKTTIMAKVTAFTRRKKERARATLEKISGDATKTPRYKDRER